MQCINKLYLLVCIGRFYNCIRAMQDMGIQIARIHHNYNITNIWETQ